MFTKTPINTTAAMTEEKHGVKAHERLRKKGRVGIKGREENKINK